MSGPPAGLILAVLAFASAFSAAGETPPVPDAGAMETAAGLPPLILEDYALEARPGRNRLRLRAEGRTGVAYPSEMDCRWTLSSRDGVADRGAFRIALPPGRPFGMTVEANVPDDIENEVYVLELLFLDDSGGIVHVHAARLRPESWPRPFIMRLDDLERDEGWRIEATAEEAVCHHRNFAFRARSPRPEWFFFTRGENVRLVTGGPFFVQSPLMDSGGFPGDAAAAEDLWIARREVGGGAAAGTIQSVYRGVALPSAEGPLEESLWFSPFGMIDLRHAVRLREGAGPAGIAFRLSPRLDELRYSGTGAIAESGGVAFHGWGVFQRGITTGAPPALSRETELMAFTHPNGYGLGLMATGRTVSVEPSPDGALVTVFMDESGRRGEWSSAFRLFALIPDQYPSLFLDTLFR